MTLGLWQAFDVPYCEHLPRYERECWRDVISYELQYVAGGGVELEIDGRRHELEAGSGWLIQTGFSYAYRPLPKYGWWDHRYLVFSKAVGDAWRATGLLPEGPWRAPAGTDIGAAMDRIMALVPRFREPCCRINALNLLERIFLDLHSAGAQAEPAWLAPVLRELNGDSPPPDYATLAARHGMSLCTLIRRFRKWTGHPPHQYYLEARARQVARLLETTDWSQKEIAARLGYADAAHLARQFRSVSGRTPGTVRKPGGLRARNVSDGSNKSRNGES
ncbi:MAG: AraC family transcriptional regulator [Lentisphaeria bacterium]